jgi:hypothetical protein
MKTAARLTTFLTAALLLLVSASMAQQTQGTVNGDAIFVFLDCNAPNCDFDHFRREINWVNWVRDRTDADVHLIVTVQRTAASGWQYTLDYLGLEDFDGITKSLTFASDPDGTDSEVREQLTTTMALGLIPFVENTAIGRRLSISYTAPEIASDTLNERVHDPWNLWTFRISTNGSLEGEAQQSGYSIRSSFSASRVTEAFKVEISSYGRYSREEYDFGDEGSFESTSESYSGDILMAWSLSDHWSSGWAADASRSTFYNYALRTSVGPLIEYDIFPYSESTRRLVTFRYGVELVNFDYLEETIEDKTGELLPRHSLSVSASVQQPWGSINGSISGEQYLNDLATHRIDTFGMIEYRIFRGLSLNVFGHVSRIKDQFYLPKTGLTDQEVLVRRQQRETNFQYYVSLGISYRFGSKFSNIVNPRMGGSGGGMTFYY